LLVPDTVTGSGTVFVSTLSPGIVLRCPDAEDSRDIDPIFRIERSERTVRCNEEDRLGGYFELVLGRLHVECPREHVEQFLALVTVVM